jgi:hypothetical protein
VTRLQGTSNISATSQWDKKRTQAMQFRSLVLLLAFGLALLADTTMTVNQLQEMVRSSLALKYDDGKIAKFLKGVKLTDKLERKTIEDLEAQGAGPKTVKALEELMSESATLKSATPASGQAAPPTGPSSSLSNYKQPSPPDSVHQKEILDAMRAYATSYTQSLPNFLCVQVTDRFVSFNGGESFHHADKILTKLSYNEGHENYKVYQVNNQSTDTTFEKLGGAISSGEFGSLMSSIFSDKSSAEFGWDHWARLRGKVVVVFNYFIDSGHSDYVLDFDRGAQRIVTAYKGLVYADENTGAIQRITFEAVDIPAGFPIREAKTILDYDDAKIGEGTFIVPLRAVVRMHGPNAVHTRNEEEFRMYQKFGTESSITFGADTVPEPLPPEKTTEEPITDPLMKGLPPPPPK